MKEQLAEFPLASVAVKVTVLFPTGNALPDTPPETWETETPGQLSEPLAENVAIAEQRPGSLVRNTLAGQVTEGASESVTVTVNAQAAVFPAASVATNETALDPTAKRLPEAPPAVWTTATPGQLSEPVAENDTTAPHWPASLFTAILPGQTTVGASTSLTVTVKEQAAVLPEPSTAVKATVVEPIPKTDPLAPPEVCTTETKPQSSVAEAPLNVTVAPQTPLSLPTEILVGQTIVGGVRSEARKTVAVPLAGQPLASCTENVWIPCPKPVKVLEGPKGPPFTLY